MYHGWLREPKGTCFFEDKSDKNPGDIIIGRVLESDVVSVEAILPGVSELRLGGSTAAAARRCLVECPADSRRCCRNKCIPPKPFRHRLQLV